MAMTFVHFVAIAVFFTKLCSSYDTGVPVLFWSPTRSFLDLPDAYYGHVMKNAEFETQYLGSMHDGGKELIIVFVQNKLNLEDFAYHADIYSSNGNGGAFRHVKSLLDDNFSLQLPAVDSPSRSIKYLKQKYAGKMAEINTPDDLNKLELAAIRLLIVRLPDIQAAGEMASFVRNDELIDRLISRLGNRDYVAIYMAESQKHEDGNTLKFRSRRLMANVNNETDIFVNSTGCFLMYTRNITLNVYNKTNDLVGAVVLGQPVVGKIQCENTTKTELIMQFSPADSNVTGVKFSMTFIETNKTSDWFIMNAVIEYNGTLPGDELSATNRKVVLKLGTSYNFLSDMWAPLGMSYHCTEPPALNERVKNGTSSLVRIAVSFDKLQLQPFRVNGDRFNVPYDCVPFFTGMIWTAIISVAILLLILFFGLSMISSIKVMQNFDDPKAKPLLTQTDD